MFTRGYYITKDGRVAGEYPTFSQKGGSLRPLLHRSAVRLSNVPEKKRNGVCVLGMGCGQLASAS